MLLPTLLISEVYPQPNTTESEWIEIYNPTSEPIDLSGLSLYEHISQTNLLIQFTSETESLVIQPQSFYVYTLGSNKLNNSEELITLESSDNSVIDSFTYTNSKLDQSFNKDISTDHLSSTNIYLAQPTPNEMNHPQALNTPNIEIKQNTTNSPTTPAPEDSKQDKITQEDQSTHKKQSLDSTSDQTVKLTAKINVPLLQYQQLSSELKKFPNTQKIKSENIKPRESKFSYLVQKHVSSQGIVNAIIGGSLLILTGFLL